MWRSYESSQVTPPPGSLQDSHPNARTGRLLLRPPTVDISSNVSTILHYMYGNSLSLDRLQSQEKSDCNVLVSPLSKVAHSRLAKSVTNENNKII